MSDTIYISRLTRDIPSVVRPGYVHRAGKEIAPVRRCGDLWEIEIRTGVPGAYWYETLLVSKEDSEVVELPLSEARKLYS